MLFGNSSPITVSLPDTQITRTRFTTPLGDTYQTYRKGKTQIFKASLSGTSKGLLQTASQGLQQQLTELSAPPQVRVDHITRLSDQQFNRQAQLIQRTSDGLKAKARSQLARRFGKAGNSTFGQIQLAQLDNNRLESLIDSRLRADVLAESLNQTDIENRFRRVGAFSNVMNELNNDSRTFASLGADTLNREAALAQQRQLALLQRNDNRAYALRNTQFLTDLYQQNQNSVLQLARAMGG